MSKTLVNGVLEPSGEPPLTHEEFLERGVELTAERAKETQAKAGRRTKKGAAATADEEGGGTSPVKGQPAHEAIDHIGRMTSKDRLQAIADNDERATVKKAAEDRLAELGNA